MIACLIFRYYFPAKTIVTARDTVWGSRLSVELGLTSLMFKSSFMQWNSLHVLVWWLFQFLFHATSEYLSMWPRSKCVPNGCMGRAYLPTSPQMVGTSSLGHPLAAWIPLSRAGKMPLFGSPHPGSGPFQSVATCLSSGFSVRLAGHFEVR